VTSGNLCRYNSTIHRIFALDESAREIEERDLIVSEPARAFTFVCVRSMLVSFMCVLASVLQHVTCVGPSLHLFFLPSLTRGAEKEKRGRGKVSPVRATRALTRACSVPVHLSIFPCVVWHWCVTRIDLLDVDYSLPSTLSRCRHLQSLALLGMK